MTKFEEQVAEFHRVFGHGIRETPGLPPEDRIRFHLGMIVEETFELLEAMNPEGQSLTLEAAKKMALSAIESHLNIDLPEAADACGDIDYVVQSFRTAFGIQAGPIADAIQAANMAKAAVCGHCNGKGYSTGISIAAGENRNCFPCGGSGRIVNKRREDGKVIKPEGWKPPDIAGELRKQGWEKPLPPFGSSLVEGGFPDIDFSKRKWPSTEARETQDNLDRGGRICEPQFESVPGWPMVKEPAHDGPSSPFATKQQYVVRPMTAQELANVLARLRALAEWSGLTVDDLLARLEKNRQ